MNEQLKFDSHGMNKHMIMIAILQPIQLNYRINTHPINIIVFLSFFALQGELTPVTNIDGRVIGSGQRGPITARLQEAYQSLPDRPGWATEIPPFE